MKNITLVVCCVLAHLVYSQENNAAWSLVQIGTDIYNGQIEMENWPNRWDIESLDMHKVEGGFLTCGYYNDQILDSRDGNDYSLLGQYGAYLAKYNYSGVIQWVVRTQKTATELRNVITSIATDSQGFIYIVGHSNGVIIDAAGVSQPVFSSSYSPPFLIKLTSNGEIVWKMIVTGAYPKKVEIDNEDNVIVGGVFLSGGENYINNVNVGSHPNLPNANYYIAKYSPAGVQMWDAGIYIDSVNAEFIEGITVDANNNIYVQGQYELDLKVYHADDINYIQRGWSGMYKGSLFLAKYTPTGNVQWVVTSLDSPDAKIVGTPDGSHYVCGSNDKFSNPSHILTNADGSILTQNQFGAYYLAKVNATGNWEWVTGASECDFAGAYAMTIHSNKLILVGGLWDWGIESASVEIHGNNGYANLALGESDLFVASYDLAGNLMHLSKSGSNEPTLVENYPTGLVIDDGGNYYLQRNMWFYYNAGPLNFYGQTIMPTLGRDAVITKFAPKASLHITLTKEEVGMTTANLSPNPTNGQFKVNLGHIYNEVSLTINDISGKIIKDIKFTDTAELFAKIEGESGIYFVTIKTSSETQRFKVIKV